MGVHKKYTLEELRVKALNGNSEHYLERYRVALEAHNQKKINKAEFEAYLREEMEKCSLGCNPYQE